MKTWIKEQLLTFPDTAESVMKGIENCCVIVVLYCFYVMYNIFLPNFVIVINYPNKCD